MIKQLAALLRPEVIKLFPLGLCIVPYEFKLRKLKFSILENLLAKLRKICDDLANLNWINDIVCSSSYWNFVNIKLARLELWIDIMLQSETFHGFSPSYQFTIIQ